MEGQKVGDAEQPGAAAPTRLSRALEGDLAAQWRAELAVCAAAGPKGTAWAEGGARAEGGAEVKGRARGRPLSAAAVPVGPASGSTNSTILTVFRGSESYNWEIAPKEIAHLRR